MTCLNRSIKTFVYTAIVVGNAVCRVAAFEVENGICRPPPFAPSLVRFFPPVAREIRVELNAFILDKP